MHLFPELFVADHFTVPCSMSLTSLLSRQGHTARNWRGLHCRDAATCQHPGGPLQGSPLLFCSTGLWLFCVGSCWTADPGNWLCWDLGSGGKQRLFRKKAFCVACEKFIVLIAGAFQCRTTDTRTFLCKRPRIWRNMVKWQDVRSWQGLGLWFGVQLVSERGQSQTMVCVVKGEGNTWRIKQVEEPSSF